MFAKTPEGALLNCLTSDSAGLRAIPNTSCWAKIAEGQPVEYKFNNCGDRAGMECGQKPPGTYRIVTEGSSFVLGYGLAREKTWTALLPTKLSLLTGRKVELYNQGITWRYPRNIALRFNDVLARQPDLILWVLTSVDISAPPVPDLHLAKVAQKGALGKPADALERLRSFLATKSIPEAMGAVWEQTRSALLLQHFLYLSQSQFVKSSLVGDDDDLKAEPSAKWKDQLRKLDGYAAEIERKAGAAGVPVVTVLMPTRAQVALISLGEWPQGIDPFKADRDVQRIVTKHGGIYLDLLPRFRDIPNPEQYFFPVDGHPNARGHELIATMLAEELNGGAAPAIRGLDSARSK
jgi:hypothetical protein